MQLVKRELRIPSSYLDFGGAGGIRTPVSPTATIGKTRFPTDLHGWELPPSPLDLRFGASATRRPITFPETALCASCPYSAHPDSRSGRCPDFTVPVHSATAPRKHMVEAPGIEPGSKVAVSKASTSVTPATESRRWTLRGARLSRRPV